MITKSFELSDVEINQLNVVLLHYVSSFVKIGVGLDKMPTVNELLNKFVL